MLRFRSKLSICVALVSVLVALYSAGWLFLAHRARTVVDAYVLRQRGQGMNLSIAAEAVEGFPFDIQVRLAGIVADGLPHVPTGRLTIPTLAAWARPWRLDAWRYSLPAGAVIDAPEGHVSFDLLGGHASAVLGPGATPGGDLADLHVDNIVIATGDRVLKAARAGVTLRLPPDAPKAHEEPLFSMALQAHKVSLPTGVAPLGPEVDHLMLEGTWRGPLPPGKLADALAAWRDDGGTIDLQGIDLGWGPLTVTADGTLALDKNMQPLGAFSARIMGYDAILDALIASGAIHQNEAALARMGLSMMALRGADGTPQLKTPITVQDGALFMGPARLMKLAKVDW